MVKLWHVIFFLVLLSACNEREKVLAPITVELESVDQIILLEDSLVKPVLYQNIPDLKHLPIKQLKENFVAVVLPAVLIARHKIKNDRTRIEKLTEKKKWSVEDSSFYEHQRNRFGAKDIQDLLPRMITHTNSITLAQAAMESGWGSSRFFKKGNNLFGIWSYNKNESRMAANESDVFLRKYDNISTSIEDYFVTLGRARAYKRFREVRQHSDDINDLLPHLNRYSERGAVYIKNLKILIKNSDFTRYDSYIIDPDYFEEE